MKALAKHLERGASSLEFVGTFIFIVIMGLVVIQFAPTGWFTMTLTDTVRDGARAQANGTSGYALIKSRLPESAKNPIINCYGGEEARCTVSVELPSIVPKLKLGNITRTAVMPSLE